MAVQPSTNTSNDTEQPARLAITDTFMRVLADAIKTCLRTRAKRLDSGWIFASLLDNELIADLLDGGEWSLQPSALTWTLGPYICSRYLHIRDQGPTIKLIVDDCTIHISDKVIDALRDGWAVADRDGLPLTPHHVVTALLSRPTAANRILGLLTTLTRQRRALIHRAIEFKLTEHISKRLTTWTKPTGSDKHRDIVEALLDQAFSDTKPSPDRDTTLDGSSRSMPTTASPS